MSPKIGVLVVKKGDTPCADEQAAMLQVLEALKGLDGVTIHLPARVKDRPDKDRLVRAVQGGCVRCPH
jgi:hypothetical protein